MYNIWFDISYRESFSINLAQQQAAGDITLAGVEMVAGADDENLPPHIICSQNYFNGAQCWYHHEIMAIVFARPCFWSGDQTDFCYY